MAATKERHFSDAGPASSRPSGFTSWSGESLKKTGGNAMSPTSCDQLCIVDENGVTTNNETGASSWKRRSTLASSFGGGKAYSKAPGGSSGFLRGSQGGEPGLNASVHNALGWGNRVTNKSLCDTLGDAKRSTSCVSLGRPSRT